MAINPLTLDTLRAPAPTPSLQPPKLLDPLPPPSDGNGSFGEVLGGFLNQVNGLQQNADQMVESLALGEPVDVHQVMLALNEATDALQLTMQVRNKALEAYQEVMKTQL